MSEMKQAYTIKPQTAVASPDSSTTDLVFPIELVAPVVGMNHSFIRRALGRKSILSEADVRQLLDQDAFSETFVPRSRVLEYLRRAVTGAVLVAESQEVIQKDSFVVGDALQLIGRLKDGSVNTVVTSTPYWAMRVYDEPGERLWADGENCSFGLEQTPEGFIGSSQ